LSLSAVSMPVTCLQPVKQKPCDLGAVFACRKRDVIIWVMTSHCIVLQWGGWVPAFERHSADFNPEGGDSMFLKNIATHLPDYKILS
jgi:hypothetical protein